MTSSRTLVSRRAFLAAATLAGGGLLIRFPLAATALAEAATPSALNAYVRIDSGGRVTLLAPYVEMGQGAYTSQVQILAEELRVDPATIVIEAAPGDDSAFASPLLGEQITGGSLSLRGAWISLRKAGAAAREMLVEAAAHDWGVPATECEMASGQVVHRATGRNLSYGTLAEAASKLSVPREPRLTDPADFKVVGRSMPRVDTTAKVTGAAVFGIDVRLPGMKHAAVAAAPVFGGSLASVDADDAHAVAGVERVIEFDNAVAVIGANGFAARKGLALLKVTWTEGPGAALGMADLVAGVDAAMDREALVATTVGDVSGAEAMAESQFEFEFRHPILAHAAMEPLNCTVHVRDGHCDVRDGHCDVWVGCQSVARARMAAAEVLGFSADQVTVHNQLLGGGFGRRLEVDYVAQAVRIARQVEGPVQVAWSREEDMRHDYYRYLNHSRVTVGIDRDGMPLSWRHRVVGPSVMARFLPAFIREGVDLDIVGGAHGPYAIPNVLVDFVRQEAPEGLATGNWRGVGATRNVVIVESVIDALAERAGRDSIEYRRSLIAEPRLLTCLNEAARMAGWGKTLPERSAMGVATMSDFASHLAIVAKVRVAPSGEVTVERVTCAIDTGIAVNPDIVRAQIEGGVVFGLSAALWGRITIRNGRVVEGNFDTYRVMRMNEAPRIDVHVVKSGEEPGGVGEPGTAAAIAAVANAVAAATGQRPTSLPLNPQPLREDA